MEERHSRRLRNWGQTPETRIADPAAAVRFIDQVGVATLFPASPEIPNLFYGYVGDTNAEISSKWDSPAGHVFGWRWELGRPEAAFYTAIVRKRPTWVSWSLLPAVLRLCAELRTTDELYDTGQISANAYKITRVMEEAGPVLSTAELRRLAGFPTGKKHRAAYLKAVAELDSRLLLAKVFSAGENDMSHAFVTARYPEHVAAAEGMSREEALSRFLLAYLPPAAYVVPGVLAKHLGLPEAEVRAGLERLREAGQVDTEMFPGQKNSCYFWRDG